MAISVWSLYKTDGNLQPGILKDDLDRILMSMGDEQLTAKEISKRCGLTNGRARMLLSAMVESGQVTARPDPARRHEPRPNVYRKVACDAQVSR